MQPKIRLKEDKRIDTTMYFEDELCLAALIYKEKEGEH